MFQIYFNKFCLIVLVISHTGSGSGDSMIVVIVKCSSSGNSRI